MKDPRRTSIHAKLKRRSTNRTLAGPPGTLVVVLAGGLSSRMGRDKSRLQHGGKTLLGHMRSLAAETGLPVRVLRKDRVRRCGPLGGIYTAFLRWNSDPILFVPCDMPFLKSRILKRVMKFSRSGKYAVFTETDHGPGFPILIPRRFLEVLEKQIELKQFSLHRLALILNAKTMRLNRREFHQATNINTPEDWSRFRKKAIRSHQNPATRAVKDAGAPSRKSGKVSL